MEELRLTPPHNPRVFFPSDAVSEGISTNFPFPRQPDESFISFIVVAAVLYKATPDGDAYWTPGIYQLQHVTPPADRVYRFYRGMGNVECLVIRLSETPNPT